MNTPEYTVTDLIETLSDYELGWSYKEQNNKHSFYGGAIYPVTNSNTSIPDDEVLGQVYNNEFISIDNKYSASIEGNKIEKKAIAVNCIDGVVVILKDSTFIRDGKRIEGYWYAKAVPQYPKPIPNELTALAAQQIYELIKKRESECEVQKNRGLSPSRLDDTHVGSKEFIHREWLWPEGFAEHYVLKHRVRPSSAFLTFIGWPE